MNFNTAYGNVLERAKEVFGEDVVYAHKGGSTETITGIFDEAYTLAEFNSEAGTQSTRPTCDVKLSDLASAPRQGDVLTIRSTDYEVMEIQKDGRGGALLVLHLVP